jgi:hypothetical protein
VFDIALLVIVLYALYVSARRRFAIGVTAVICVAYLWLAAAAGTWWGRAEGAVPAGHGFAYVFWGPSGVPNDGVAWLPLSRAAGRQSWWVSLLDVAIALVPFAVATRKANGLRPESDEARALDRNAKPFLGLAVMSALFMVLRLLLQYVLPRVTI